jgi:phosphoglycolate phosphatase-like HAD superfamily hydrolase
MGQHQILALFDIDGTLVRGAQCHYMAFVNSVKKFYGLNEDISGINYAGKTDPQILREVLELGGIPENVMKGNFQNCLDDMASFYIQNVHKENIIALNGVNELLNKLKDQNVLMGLTTGNLEIIAHAKLGKAGIDKFFPFGGFGSDSAERQGLVKKALERAKNNYGYHDHNIFVIGDTPRDVEAAKPFKLQTIAVATGSYTITELESTGADFVLENLEDTENFLKIIKKE